MVYANQAKLIRQAREKLGMTQLELARKFNFTSSQAISNVERGLAPFPFKRARKLCDILKIKYTSEFKDAVLKDRWAILNRKGMAA